MFGVASIELKACEAYTRGSSKFRASFSVETLTVLLKLRLQRFIHVWSAMAKKAMIHGEWKRLSRLISQRGHSHVKRMPESHTTAAQRVEV